MSFTYKGNINDCHSDNFTSTFSETPLQGYDHSPHPEVDHFIEGVIGQGGVQGYIRRWSYFSQGALLVYDIAKNRWCERIGRPHKSNNIMYVLVLLFSTKNSFVSVIA